MKTIASDWENKPSNEFYWALFKSALDTIGSPPSLWRNMGLLLKSVETVVRDPKSLGRGYSERDVRNQCISLWVEQIKRHDWGRRYFE